RTETPLVSERVRDIAGPGHSAEPHTAFTEESRQLGNTFGRHARHTDGIRRGAERSTDGAALVDDRDQKRIRTVVLAVHVFCRLAARSCPLSVPSDTGIVGAAK